MLVDLIKDYLVRDAGVKSEVLDRPGLMVSELGLDSLDLVEMLFEIEDRCGFQLNDPLRFQAMTFAEMVATIETEVREHNSGELPVFESLNSAAGGK